MSTEVEEIFSVTSAYEQLDASSVECFSDLPLSSCTKKGLQSARYIYPTEIQKESIGFALRGSDILGAAKTGSGKTLAFLIPVVECLWKSRWTQLDGLGALIISPTRELAFQIYEVLKKVGAYHDFSAALLIGGTELEFERGRVARTNIIICTPGRLLQHMDENPSFTCDNLQILVLDEADRILDLGFAKQLNAVIENLPADRQTLLFSATQTKSVKDLARLSLKDPVYISVHEHASNSTPEKLQQTYMVCEEEIKLSVIWSFIKNHLHKKVLVFLATCKQVRFVYDAFRRLRPGTILMALHGALSQQKRVEAFRDFCERECAVLFATDVAARGLDFPDVNWVVQLDCPADAHEYIHRVGRTARYQSKGQALLILTPAQLKPMLADLEKQRIPISCVNANPKKVLCIRNKLQILCAQDSELKTFAQRAVVAYIRSVFMMKNKQIFDVRRIELEKFSESFGLAIAPRVRFLRKSQNIKDSRNRCEQACTEERIDRRSKLKVERELACLRPSDDDSGDDDLLIVKRTDVSTNIPEATFVSSIERKTKRAKARQNRPKKTILPDELDAGCDVSDRDEDAKFSDVLDFEKIRKQLSVQDKTSDAVAFKERIKAKHKERKRKLKLREAELKGKRLKQPREAELIVDESEDFDLFSWLPDPDKYYRKDADEYSGTNFADQLTVQPGQSAAKQDRTFEPRLFDHMSTRESEAIALKLLHA